LDLELGFSGQKLDCLQFGLGVHGPQFCGLGHGHDLGFGKVDIRAPRHDFINGLGIELAIVALPEQDF